MRENMALIQEAAKDVKPIASNTMDAILINEEANLQRTRPIFNARGDNGELRLQE